MKALLEATRRVEQGHFWWRGLRRFIRPLVADALHGRANPRILDCGCGTGANLVVLSEFGRTFGFDLSPHGLEFARGDGQARITNASVTHIPFQDGVFDLVTIFDVLYTLGEEQEAAAVAEALACFGLAARSSSMSPRWGSYAVSTLCSAARSGDPHGAACGRSSGTTGSKSSA